MLVEPTAAAEKPPTIKINIIRSGNPSIGMKITNAADHKSPLANDPQNADCRAFFRMTVPSRRFFSSV